MKEPNKPVAPSLNKARHFGQKLAKTKSLSGQLLLIEGERKIDHKPKIKNIKKIEQLLGNDNLELRLKPSPQKNNMQKLDKKKFELIDEQNSYLDQKLKLDVEINDSFSRNSSTNIINSSIKKGNLQNSHLNGSKCKFCKSKLLIPQLSLDILYKLYEEKALKILNSNIISDIIFNPKSRIRCIYKDCLIYDCPTEFLERYYSSKESSKVLKLFSEFAANSFHLGPNYFCLIEKKYMFRGIAKKLKIHYDRSKRGLNRINNFPNGENENIFNSTFLKQIEASKNSRNEDLKNNEFKILIDNFMKEDSIQHSFLNKKALSYNSDENIFPEEINIQQHPKMIKVDKLTIDPTITHKKKLILKKESEEKPLKKIKEVSKRQKTNSIILNPIKTQRVSMNNNHCLSLESLRNSSSLDTHEPIKFMKPFNKLALKNKKKLSNFPHSPTNFSPLESSKNENKINSNYKNQAKNFKNKIAISNSKGEGLVRSLSTKIREKNRTKVLAAFGISHDIKLNKLQLNGNLKTKSRLVISGNKKNVYVCSNIQNVVNSHIINH